MCVCVCVNLSKKKKKRHRRSVDVPGILGVFVLEMFIPSYTEEGKLLTTMVFPSKYTRHSKESSGK